MVRGAGRNNPAAARIEHGKEAVEFHTKKIEGQLITYEEVALVANEPLERSWTGIRSLFSWPLPNRIRELGLLPYRPYRRDKGVFFQDRLLPQERLEGEEQDSDDDDDDNYDNHSQRSVSSNPARDLNENKYIECGFFCMRQLIFSRIWLFIIQFIGAEFLGANNRFKTDAFDLMDRSTSALSQLGNKPIVFPDSRASIFGEYALRRMFAGLRRWDAQHFLWITDNSYIFEQSLAFFPALPELMSNLAVKVREMYFPNSPDWVVAGALYISINNLLFHVTGLLLYLLTVIITRSPKKGMLAVSLFAFNPASIFFSAAYSEAVFAAVTFFGIVFLIYALRLSWRIQRLGCCVGGACAMAFSVLFRSNGLLNAIFIGWYTLGALSWEPITKVEEPKTLKTAIANQRNEQTKKMMNDRLREITRRQALPKKVFSWTDHSFSRFCIFFCTLIIVPFAVFSFMQPNASITHFLVDQFCNGTEFTVARLERLKKVFDIPKDWVTVNDAINKKVPWCIETPSEYELLPPYYSTIQTKYWDVGFMKYWQVKKIPCFLLMLPAAILTVSAIRYTLDDVFNKKKWNNIFVLFGRSDHLIPFAIHASIMLFSAIFFYNAEVFTRIIFSSSPFLYIYLAEWVDERTQGDSFGNRFIDFDKSPGIFPFFVLSSFWKAGWKEKLVVIYFLSYFVFGSMAHAAWLPFT